MTKFAVIGAGNGGCSLAVHLTLSGYEVNLYNRQEASFSPIEDLGGVYFKGLLGTGFAKFAYTGSDIARTLEDVQDIIIVVPRNTHEHYANIIKPYLRQGMGIAVIPGSGTSLMFSNVWHDEMKRYELDLMETSTLPYSTRLEKMTEVNIYEVRKNLPALSLTGYQCRIWQLLNSILNFSRQDNIVAAILSNLNPVLHPPGMIMNAGWIENDGDFFFYTQGCSPSVAKVMESVDKERCNILRSYGLPAKNLVELFYSANYTDKIGYRSGTIYGALQNSKANSNIKAPKSLKYRFLCEDIFCGLVAFSSLAQITETPTPTIDSLIHLASLIDEIPYQEKGLNLSKMGLDGKAAEEILCIGRANCTLNKK